MSNALTARQAQVLAFLKSHHQEHGVMPSTREIQGHFGFASQTAAMSHLRALERKGVINRLAGKARAVVFPEDLDRTPVLNIPVYGNIAAGMAEATEEEKEGTVSLDAGSLGLKSAENAFALKVRGESMIDAHICPGDTVILERKEPRHRDIVAALIDGETTLKRYLSQNGHPFLQAENVDFPDLIPLQELTVQGVMVGLVRRALP